jgi:hypothetical protein
MVIHWFRRRWLIALVVMVGVVSVAPTRAQSITTFSIDPRGTFDPQTGQATISGTIACSEPLAGFIEVSLQQRAGRLIVVGSGFTDVACSPEGTTWSVTVSGPGRFAGGAALASARAEFVVDGTVITAETSQQVRLRGAPRP